MQGDVSTQRAESPHLQDLHHPGSSPLLQDILGVGGGHVLQVRLVKGVRNRRRIAQSDESRACRLES